MISRYYNVAGFWVVSVKRFCCFILKYIEVLIPNTSEQNTLIENQYYGSSNVSDYSNKLIRELLFPNRRSEIFMLTVYEKYKITHTRWKKTVPIRGRVRLEVVYINEGRGARFSTHYCLTVVIHLQQLENCFAHLQSSALSLFPNTNCKPNVLQ